MLGVPHAPPYDLPVHLVSVADLSAPSLEHIIPDALGGPNGFSVTADREMNSQLGTSDLINDHALKFLAMSYGVKNRTGDVAIDKYAVQISGLLKTEAANSRKQRRTLKQLH